MVTARAAIEKLYTGVCTITNKQKVIKNKRTVHEDIGVCENQKCRLSYNSSPNANQTETVAIVSQTIKLFIAPELEVLPGSKIQVTQNNVTRTYKASGIRAVYSSHQEINLIDETEC